MNKLMVETSQCLEGKQNCLPLKETTSFQIAPS